MHLIPYIRFVNGHIFTKYEQHRFEFKRFTLRGNEKINDPSQNQLCA